jgi:hypothetical protein
MSVNQRIEELQEEMDAELRTLLDRLASLGVVVEFADHLNDRELYSWLSEQLGAHMAVMPGSFLHFSPIGGGSEEDNQIYLTYYATDDERTDWKASFPDEELPPRKRPPYNRDVPQPCREGGDVS